MKSTNQGYVVMVSKGKNIKILFFIIIKLVTIGAIFLKKQVKTKQQE